MKRPILALAAVILAGCTTPLPQDSPPGTAAAVPVPQIREGEAWSYSVHDGFTGLPRPAERHRVVEATAERIVVTVSRERRGEETQVFDPRWNWVRRPGTNLQMFEYSPAYQALVFPMTAGATWDARTTATDPATGRRFPVVIQGKVMGWERVKVPAGEFDTLKVRRVVFLHYYEPSVRDHSEIIETEWYAPAVKQAVRRETTSRYLSHFGANEPGFLRVRGGRGDGGGPRFVQDDWLIYELVGHTTR